MWQVSDHYLATLARSHQQISYLEVLKDGQVQQTLQGGFITDPATGVRTSTIGGRVDVSKTNIRRSGTVTFLDASGQLLPESVQDLFAPYVTELRVWVGVRYWDAPLPAITDSSGLPALQVDTELVPIATLIITEIDSEYPQITITGSDRMWLLGSFTAPYTVAAGTETVAALSSLLAANIPDSRLATNFLTQGELTTPALTFDAESSIADAAHRIAQTAGWQLYVDPLGTFTIAAEPSTDDDAVFTYTPGLDGKPSMVMRPKRTVGGDMYNAVVFTGEGGSTSPVRGYAQDDDPTSLTYVGRVGVRPYFESSPLVTTSAQAALAAKTTLTRILGVADTIAVPVVPNHALECGDVIHVTDPLQQIDLDLIVDSFSVPLRATDGAMTLQCRSRVMR